MAVPPPSLLRWLREDGGETRAHPPYPEHTESSRVGDERCWGGGWRGRGSRHPPLCIHGGQHPCFLAGMVPGDRGCSCSPEEEVVGAVVPAHCLAAAGQAEILVAIPATDHQHLGFGEGEGRGTGA